MGGKEGKKGKMNRDGRGENITEETRKLDRSSLPNLDAPNDHHESSVIASCNSAAEH
jgi:hypothetical protein